MAAHELVSVLGASYSGGRAAFSGDALLSPVGARVLRCELSLGRQRCLPLEALAPVALVVAAPGGRLALLVDAGSRALLVDLAAGVVLHHLTFSDAVRDARFSPDGLHLAAACGRFVRLYRAPRPGRRRHAPLARLRTFGGYGDALAALDWSADSRLLLVACDDTSVKVHSLVGAHDAPVAALVGHRAPPVAAFFVGAARCAAIVSADGAVYLWQRADAAPDAAEALPGWGDQGEHSSDEGNQGGRDGGALGAQGAVAGGGAFVVANAEAKDADGAAVALPWRLLGKHFFGRTGRAVTACDCHRSSGLLLTGFSDGTFALHRLPSFQHLQSLSVSSGVLDTAAISPAGDKLALGCSEYGQMLVWDWRSESYALRQQGHRTGALAVAWAPDSATLATAGGDGKVKVGDASEKAFCSAATFQGREIAFPTARWRGKSILLTLTRTMMVKVWNRESGMCFVTFSEHAAAVTALTFMPSGHALVSASLDGTVRAFDLVRYRNFRTFAAPHAVQFVSVAVDGGGEVVAAGTLEPFKVFVWSLRTGQLLSALAGHTGPIYALAFVPLAPVLASGSWDKTVRLWNVFSGYGCIASLQHSHEVLALAPRPDGKQLCTATLDGQLSFWDADDGELKGTLECRRDVGGGQGEDQANRCFRSLSYSSDGTMVLAGGKSRHVCLYDVVDKVLLRRWAVGPPRHSLGHHAAVVRKGSTTRPALRSGLGLDEKLAGEVLPGLLSDAQRVSNAPGTTCVRFAADGRSWAAATAAGTALFSLDGVGDFGPVHLGADITPLACEQAMVAGRWARAIALAAQLDSEALLIRALTVAPPDERAAAAVVLPHAYLARVMGCVAQQIDSGAHLEAMLRWAHLLLRAHGHLARQQPAQHLPALRTIKQAVVKHQAGLVELAEQNASALLYVSQAHGTSFARAVPL